MSSWTLGPENGTLTLHTGVTGAAARMGHRLTIVMDAWTISVDGPDDQPSAVSLVVDVDSLRVESGEGGLTPLTGPEKTIVRSNALKTLNSQRFPTIEFHAEQIGKTAAGYVMRGALTIHGATRAADIELSVAADGALSLSTDVSQRAYGIKPFSMAMGSLKVADAVTVSFEGRRPGA
ncbi:YceI family protein [Mycobacteroides abscessus]|uniref:YceI family protein n=1 Tax=Mycobacteroides abscessus TaxID=36809 RepID=UPI0009A827EC|nr:YceI family protein [Mycobacteroides abscessus]